MNSDETIVAIATPPGRGGIGVIRVSGTRVPQIAKQLIGDIPVPRAAALRAFRDADGIELDRGLVIFFAAPASFTGEDVLELHGHGGPVLLDLIVSRILQLGARLAAPGEFSQRAFLNDKLDLIQAEAIADLIDSSSQQAARAAMRSLQGDFSARIHSLTEALIEARVHVEAAIDFPEEEIDFLADAALKRRIDDLRVLIDQILSTAQQGALLRDGMTVVFAGRPNAGKSSLLNALAGYEAAIVTAIPGTTRDVLRERISIDGMPLHVIDTAGLRETQDIIETEGIKRAHREMAKADRILYVVDVESQLSDVQLIDDLNELPPHVPITVLVNKIDLINAKSAVGDGLPTRILLSAHTGDGIDLLRTHLKECMGYRSADVGIFSARRRHLDALRRVQQNVEAAAHLLADRRAGELMADELRQAQQHVNEITGEFTSDDLLGKIFSSFCIGK